MAKTGGRQLSLTPGGGGELERKFYERYGRRHRDASELDAFAISLRHDADRRAERADSARQSVLGTVLRHNLDEASRDIDRQERREDLLMRYDPKFARRMMREWKKDQPHKVQTLDRGVEWLPGNVDDPGRTVRFRDKQSALDYTQRNRRTAAVPMESLDELVSMMVAADEEQRNREAGKAARAAVNGGSTALDDYQFKWKAGEGVDEMLARLEKEVGEAAAKQFAPQREARAQRAVERAQRAMQREAERAQRATQREAEQAQRETQRAQRATDWERVAQGLPTGAIQRDILAYVDRQVQGPKAPEPIGTSAPTPVAGPGNAPAAAKPASRWPLVDAQLARNEQTRKELDDMTARIEADWKHDRFPEKSEYEKAWEEIRRAPLDSFKQGVKFTWENDFKPKLKSAWGWRKYFERRAGQ